MARPHPSPHEPRLARVAAQIADPSRARMLAYLLGGEYASAGELARAASVGAATASEHLQRLLGEGFLVCEPRGRHRYYRLADAEIAHALEALALVAERGSHAREWARPERMRLREARCCYGHLAGRLGVALLDGLLQRGWLQAQEHGYALTEAGEQGLRALGLEPPGSARGGGRLAYACMDWSERRDHLAGQVASALLQHFLARRWLRRLDGERALVLTPAGAGALAPLLARPAPG